MELLPGRHVLIRCVSLKAAIPTLSLLPLMRGVKDISNYNLLHESYNQSNDADRGR